MRLYLALVLLTSALAQTPTALPDAKELDVSTGDWTDTGVDVRVGDSLMITATGTLTLPQPKGASKDTGPNGASRGFRDLIKSYPVNQAGLGALIGRIGSSDAAVAFLVGESKRLDAVRTGRLFLNLNRTANDTITGSFHVKIEFSSRGPEVTGLPASVKLPEITAEIVDRFPRRVVDKDGNEGDNSNFVIVGPEKKMLQAFDAAGWVKVDKDEKSAVLSAVLATLNKQDYLTLPMSQLMMFGRNQDYGMAHAEPLAVVAQRHHLRLWKAPFEVDGQELWVGAGTHDIGFDRDQRNNGVTHKIDPDVDVERDFIGQSLQESGLVAKTSYVIPGKPNKEAKTATGGTFHSDGRILVIYLMPDTAATTTATR